MKPGGISDTTAPAAISRACSPRIRAGYGVSAPPASTATGAAAATGAVAAPSATGGTAGRASSAPACAAESIPSAMPERPQPRRGEPTAERA